MKRSVLVFSWVLLACLVCFLAGCTPDLSTAGAGHTPPNADILRIGVSANAPPLIFKADGELTGLEVALAKRFAAFLGKEPVLIEVDWDQQLAYLQDNKTDIVMSGMTITEKRGYLVNFSRPYLRSGQIMLVRMQDRAIFSTGIPSVMNTTYRIGTVKGTTSDFFVTSTIIGAQETEFETSQAAVDALIAEDIDVFIYDAPIICYYAAKHQQDKVVPVLQMATEEYLGWAIRKTDQDLLNQANRFIEQISADGTLKNEISIWIPYLTN